MRIYQAQQQAGNAGSADTASNAGTTNDDGSINGEYEEKK